MPKMLPPISRISVPRSINRASNLNKRWLPRLIPSKRSKTPSKSSSDNRFRTNNPCWIACSTSRWRSLKHCFPSGLAKSEGAQLPGRLPRVIGKKWLVATFFLDWCACWSVWLFGVGHIPMHLCLHVHVSNMTWWDLDFTESSRILLFAVVGWNFCLGINWVHGGSLCFAWSGCPCSPWSAQGVLHKEAALDFLGLWPFGLLASLHGVCWCGVSFGLVWSLLYSPLVHMKPWSGWMPQRPAKVGAISRGDQLHSASGLPCRFGLSSMSCSGVGWWHWCSTFFRVWWWPWHLWFLMVPVSVASFGFHFGFLRMVSEP